MKPLYFYGGGAALVAIAGLWLAHKVASVKPKVLGEAAGGAVADVVMGTIAGVNDGLGIPRTSDVIAAANNPDINPLQPFGAWLGASIYDVLHPV